MRTCNQKAFAERSRYAVRIGIYQDETPKADVETNSKAVLIGPEAKTFGSFGPCGVLNKATGLTETITVHCV
jgi:hypothetical protein